MAAPVYQSIGTVSRISASTNVVIPKPTGLASGDLMIAHVFFRESVARSVNTLSGWTLVSGTSQETSIYTFYKTADSSDAAASNFTFVGSGNLTYAAGVIYRITNQATGVEIHANELDYDNVNETTKEFTTAITPRTAESLIILTFGGWSQASVGVPTVASYSTTPTVTFTERADLGADDGANGYFFGTATGSYTGTTQFTSRQAVISETTQSPGCSSVLLILNQIENATGTNATLTISPLLSTQNGAAGGQGTNTTLAVSPNFTDQSGQGTAPTMWSNEARNTTIWDNEEQS